MQKTDSLESLVSIAKVQSTEASNRIEGIVTTEKRINEIMQEKTMPKTRDEEKIMETYLTQEETLNSFGLNFKYLKNHILTPIDVQNLFCEFDKYLREANPSLKSNRTKIKSKYKKTNGDINYILPKKWNAKI